MLGINGLWGLAGIPDVICLLGSETATLYDFNVVA